MPLQAHTAHSPAGLPIDETTRPELVDFGTKNLRSENVRQNQRGATEKRAGFAAMPVGRSDGTTPTAGYKLFADRSSIVRVTDSGQAESFSSALSAWVPMNRMPEATATLLDVPSMGITTFLEDIDATNGYTALSWVSISFSGGASGALAAIIDQRTGTTIRSPERVGSSSTFSPLALSVLGNYFIAAQWVGSTISAWYLDTTSSATIANGWVAYGATLAIDAASNPQLHALPSATTPRVAVLYINSSGSASQLTLLTIDISGIVQSRSFNTSGLTPTACGIGGVSTDTLWCAWNETALIYAQGVSPFTISTNLATKSTALLGLVAGCLTIGIVGSTVTAGKARVCAVDSVAALPQSQMRGIQTSAGVAVADGSAFTLAGVRMVRKPFTYGGRYYSAFLNADPNGGQSNFFVCDWTDNAPTIRPIANAAPNISSVGLTSIGKFVAGPAPSTWSVGLGLRRSAIATGSALLVLDFADARRWQTVAHASSTFIASAVPSYSDGTRIAEIGFLYRPLTPTTTTASTGITAATGWRYVCVFEETDANGNWCVSGLSNPSASTGAVANKTVFVTTQPLCITSRAALNVANGSTRGVRIAFYRTLDGGNPPYYRVGTVLNDGTGASVVYQDTTSDATLAAASQLYEQPGVPGTSQDRRVPPFFSCITSYNGMLVGASGSDVWYSGQNVVGEGVWFNPVFQTPIPGDGPITGLAALDGTLFIFKRRDVFAIAGDAPADNGSSGGLGAPRRIASDVGCIEPRSTCTTSLGVMFQSERGIEILTRAQTVEWLGEPFDVTIDANAVCTSITVEPIANVAIVELATAQASGTVTGTGCAIVYDLSIKSWVSKDIRLTSGVPAQSACIVPTTSGARYAWLSAAGAVYTETQGASLDAGAWVTSLIETGHARHGLQQEQRLWSGMLLFEREAAAGLKVEVGYDYATYQAGDNKVWTEAETLARVQLEWRPRPRGQAMRFRISDTAPAVLGTGQGITFIGLSLNMAPKQGSTTGTPRLDPSLRK